MMINLDIQRNLEGQWVSVWNGAVVPPLPGHKQAIEPDPNMGCGVRVVIGTLKYPDTPKFKLGDRVVPVSLVSGGGRPRWTAGCSYEWEVEEIIQNENGCLYKLSTKDRAAWGIPLVHGRVPEERLFATEEGAKDRAKELRNEDLDEQIAQLEEQRR